MCLRIAAQETVPTEPHRVLVLYSYRLDYRWTALIHEGILEGAAQSPSMDLDFYFLDAQHKAIDLFTPAHEAHLAEIFRLGYGPKTVLAIDDPALRFVIGVRPSSRT